MGAVRLALAALRVCAVRTIKFLHARAAGRCSRHRLLGRAAAPFALSLRVQVATRKVE